MKKIFKKRNITIVQSKKKPNLFYISHPSTSIGILRNDNNEILLVEQYREIFKQSFLELPGGLINSNENPKEAIKREFLEETGYLIEKADLITSIIPSIGLSNEKINIFKVHSNSKTIQNLDTTESITIKWVSLNECIKMIKLKKIIDAKTIVGILLLNQTD